MGKPPRKAAFLTRQGPPPLMHCGGGPCFILRFALMHYFIKVPAFISSM